MCAGQERGRGLATVPCCYRSFTTPELRARFFTQPTRNDEREWNIVAVVRWVTRVLACVLGYTGVDRGDRLDG